MKDQNPTIGSRLKYRFDNFFAKGGFSIFVSLIILFILAFIIMAGIRVVINVIYPVPVDSEIRNIYAQLWRALLQITDIGAMENDSASDQANKLMGFTTSIAGLLHISICNCTILRIVEYE